MARLFPLLPAAAGLLPQPGPPARSLDPGADGRHPLPAHLPVPAHVGRRQGHWEASRPGRQGIQPYDEDTGEGRSVDGQIGTLLVEAGR